MQSAVKTLYHVQLWLSGSNIMSSWSCSQKIPQVPVQGQVGHIHTTTKPSDSPHSDDYGHLPIQQCRNVF